MMVRYNRKTKRRSLLDFFGAAAFVAILVVSVAWLERNNATEISAAARIVDGDSLEMNSQKVRLVGIDAPELNQVCQVDQVDYLCGKKARDHLHSLIADRETVHCVGEGNDKYGRLLAECFIGELSLNLQMVRDGWAISYGGFGWVERKARNEMRGLWAGEFDDPSDWRTKTGGLLEIQSGALLRGIWRWTMSWFVPEESI